MNKVIKLTYGEISARWGMSDDICNKLGLNPYYLNEGGDKTVTAVYLNEEDAAKIGILYHEFEDRHESHNSLENLWQYRTIK